MSYLASRSIINTESSSSSTTPGNNSNSNSNNKKSKKKKKNSDNEIEENESEGQFIASPFAATLLSAAAAGASEKDPLLQKQKVGARQRNDHLSSSSSSISNTGIRARRSSKSPVQKDTQTFDCNPDEDEEEGYPMYGGPAYHSEQLPPSHSQLQQQQQQQEDAVAHTQASLDGYESIDEANYNNNARMSALAAMGGPVAAGDNDTQLSSVPSSATSASSRSSSLPIYTSNSIHNNDNLQQQQSLNSQQQQSHQQQHAAQHQQQQTPSLPYRGMPQSPGNDNRSISSSSQPPLLEIPEEIYAVRKSALQVLKPLTKTWVVVSVGFALTVLFGTARWTRLIPGLPFWFILLPCWSAHVALLWLHLLSAQALSAFIAEANESRQRPDSRDHLNRTEYLPLLQRSLKYGLKTGILSCVMFVFEILIYIRLARGTISLTAAFTPLWILVVGGILDGLICKTQHAVRVICWLLLFTAMLLTVMKVDYRHDHIRWRVVVSPVVAVLSIASATLIYIVYGHQVGYYRLTESQLTAGNLYSLAALVCIVLVVMIGEVIPLSRPVEIETRLLVVILAPLVVCLVGMGAWVVSRDEFARLLLYGGQAAVHPMKLRWEANGWTSVQGKGVTIVPMFGEVSFQPLERKPASRGSLELCSCCCNQSFVTAAACTCYPYETEDEETVHLTEDLVYHPYLDPSQPGSRGSYSVLRGV